VTRVALCHPTYWPEVRRGAERLVHDLATGLAAAGDDVRVVTSQPARGTVVRARAPLRAVEDGVEVLRLPRLPGGRLERRRFEPHIQTLPLLYAALRAGHDDVIHAFQAGDAAVAARIDTPSVYAHMGIPHRAWLTARRGRLALVQDALECTATTALSEHARDAFHRWLGVEAQVIPPPIDTTTFSPGGERTEHPTIICAADAREPRKRVALLIEAFHAVRRTHPQAQLWLDASTARTIAPGVELKDMTDLPALYRQAWVSALPSWGEAFGLVLAEALACGTPVVGANREGIPEVLGGDDRIGRVFDGDDPEPLTRALLETLELAQDPQTAAQCRARAERFSVQSCVNAHQRLYRSLH
jgi:glycosyltransferase involved in cell wall biosynthesis